MVADFPEGRLDVGLLVCYFAIWEAPPEDVAAVLPAASQAGIFGTVSQRLMTLF